MKKRKQIKYFLATALLAPSLLGAANVIQASAEGITGDESAVSTTKEKYPIVPFRTEDFQITVDGVNKTKPGVTDIYVVDSRVITFNRDDQFSNNLSYRLKNEITGDIIVNWTNSASIDLSAYTDTEGIICINIRGYAEDDISDSGTIHNLKMKTTSFVTVSEPTNPSTIEVGRVEDGYAGSGSSYSWQITDEAGNVVLQGTDDQPDMAAVHGLPSGTYTVTNTAKEFYPPEFDEGFVEHTSTDTFSIESGQVTVHYVDENGQPIVDDETISGLAGSTYQTTPKKIPGYELVPVKTTGNETGTYDSANAAEVTYVYRLLPKKEAEVKENNGENNADPKANTADPAGKATQKAADPSDPAKKANKLPKTNTQATSVWTLVGSLMVAASAAYAVECKKKEFYQMEENENETF